jgi:hypothetical protein
MKIDVLTVSGSKTHPFPGGIDFVKLNHDIMKVLNPGVVIKWHVAVLEGQVSKVDLNISSDIKIYSYKLSDLDCKYILEPSNQHGELLNHLIKDVNIQNSGLSEKFIIVDPDCFIIKPNFIEDSVLYMENSKISIFGFAYPSTSEYLNLYWDFPTAFFMIVDKKRIKLASLDFRPDESRFFETSDTPWGCDTESNYQVFPFIRRQNFYKSIDNIKNLRLKILIKAFVETFGFWERYLLRDTGWKVRQHLLINGIKSKEIASTTVNNLKSSLSIQKYITYGIDSDYYLNLYQDVYKSGLNPLYHYTKYGKKENRNAIDPAIKLEFYFSKFFSNVKRLFKNDIHSPNWRSEISNYLHLNNYKIPDLNFFSDVCGLYFFNSHLVGIHLGHMFKKLNPDLTIIESELRKFIKINNHSNFLN